MQTVLVILVIDVLLARKQRASVIKQLTQATKLILKIKSVSFPGVEPDYH